MTEIEIKGVVALDKLAKGDSKLTKLILDYIEKPYGSVSITSIYQSLSKVQDYDCASALCNYLEAAKMPKHLSKKA